MFDGSGRLLVLGLVLGLAAAGALLKIFWLDCPEWLGMGLYLGLSAVVVVCGPPDRAAALGRRARLARGRGPRVPARRVHLRAQMARPLARPHFGHHEIWHLFVLVGAGAHFAFTYSLVGRSFPPF